MENLRYFENRTPALQTTDAETPQVWYIEDEDLSLFSDYSEDDIPILLNNNLVFVVKRNYFSFRSISDSTIALTITGKLDLSISYSFSGLQWKEWDFTPINLSTGDVVFFKNNSTWGQQDSENYCTFTITGHVEAKGNLSSLITNSDNFDDPTETYNSTPYMFYKLFSGCNGLISISNLIFPTFNTLSNNCYEHMFSGCTSLTTVPSNLLPATTCAESCYAFMFSECSALQNPPTLPATTLAKYCYRSMFNGCSSLINLPTLPATTLERNCYLSMFQGCTAITTIPNNYLSATTLATSCYYSMFQGCSGLISVPNNLLSVTTLVRNCYTQMFQDCINLTIAPKLPATTLIQGCYQYMFLGCKTLTSLTCNATDISAINCIDLWLSGISTNGILYVDPSMINATWNIPSTWTIQAIS